MSLSLLRRYLLPVALAVMGGLLLLRLFLSSQPVLVPEHLDVVVLVSLLGAAIILAIHTIVRISMSYLRLLSVQRARRETIAEHGRFLRRLDHELKNPLTTLRTGLKTLALTTLDEQQQHLVNTMEIEAVRLTQLVTDLRKLAELEAQPLNLQSLDLKGFVQSIVEVEHGRFQTSGRTLTHTLDVARNEWIADEDLLALAVHNLLDNALKYSRSDDTIRLDVVAHHDLVIQVTDHGQGIPADALPYVWEELYRAPHIERVTGSGIGLSLVKAIVERQGGSVAIESKPGRYTTVTLRLPPISQP